MAIKVEERELSLVERLYIREVTMGLALTMRHFIRNMSVHIGNLFGLAKGKRYSPRADASHPTPFQCRARMTAGRDPPKEPWAG